VWHHISTGLYKEELRYIDGRSKNVKVEKNESGRRRYRKERYIDACERAWKRQKGRCVLTVNGSWEYSLGAGK
jgi:hypothetical protein